MVNYKEAMALAINLARKGIGAVSPNPLVGAVILKDGNIIATGYHHKFGKIHAEIDAINNAGDIDFSETTLVVNLEPCSHHGKQPPCVDTIIKKKFKQVVISMLDPNPLVAGKGKKILQEAGINVTTGILENESKWLNRAFIKHITSGLPYISLKTAQSINGAIATSTGDSKWISGKKSRIAVHKLRSEYDAVAVGKNTVLTDNPELTVRLVEGRNPYRIVFDTKLSVPEHYKLFSDANLNKTIIVTSVESKNSDKAKRLIEKGIGLLFVDTDENGKIILMQALQDLYSKFMIASILVEGGSILFNSFLEKGFIDEYHIFVAPRVVPNGLNAFRGTFAIEQIDNSPQFELIKSEMSGNDLHLLYVRK